jgi:multiple sugar transport system permease protein
VAVAITLGNLVFCSMLGYALAKLRFPGKRFIFLLVLGTLMVPGVVTFVPLFVLVSNLGMTKQLPRTHLSVAGRAVRSVPDAAVHPLAAGRADSGRPDGRCERVPHLQQRHHPAVQAGARDARDPHLPDLVEHVPVAARGRPVEERYTLPVALAIYAIGENRSDFGLLMAGSVVVIAPILLVFLVLQRHFVQGIAMTGIK